MNTLLWNKILEFNPDHPLSEYGFTTRLAKENFWTTDFSERAIMEYKKFMYLAGTSDLMVSPSPVVDVVWHQHLIFTQSYSDLCTIIGKNIQHIPSTHNKEDATKFRLAKERTKKYYREIFGEQPVDIWEYDDMFESLHLKKGAVKIRTFVICGIAAFMALIIPSYYLLKPYYIHIDNPDFLINYLSIAAFVFIGLDIYNRTYLNKMVSGFQKHSFVMNLRPPELIYLKTGDIYDVIHGSINKYIERGKIIASNKNGLEPVAGWYPETTEEFAVHDALYEEKSYQYPVLLKRLEHKPVFTNTVNAMEALKKYIIKSKKFGQLFYLNFAVLSIAVMPAVIRVLTGTFRHKPTAQVVIVMWVAAIASGYYLIRLTSFICTNVIPRYYKTIIIPQVSKDDDDSWSYFLLGTTALSASFIPMIDIIERKKKFGGGNCGGSSCGSGCGSSCSSCGGCGGD